MHGATTIVCPKLVTDSVRLCAVPGFVLSLETIEALLACTISHTNSRTRNHNPSHAFSDALSSAHDHQQWRADLEHCGLAGASDECRAEDHC